jgi:hypothetical protein
MSIALEMLNTRITKLVAFPPMYGSRRKPRSSPRLRIVWDKSEANMMSGSIDLKAQSLKLHSGWLGPGVVLCVSFLTICLFVGPQARAACALVLSAGAFQIQRFGTVSADKANSECLVTCRPGQLPIGQTAKARSGYRVQSLC